MPDPFNDLRGRLLAGGIAPGHVARLLGELADHAADIEDDLVADGLDRQIARTIAFRRLGEPAEIAERILDDRRFRSWLSRAPALLCLVAPLLLQTAMTGVSAVLLMLLAARGAGDRLSFTAFILSAVLAAVPVAVAWWMALAAARQRMPMTWPVIGSAAIVLAGASLQLGVGLPAPHAQGYIALALSLPDLLPTLVAMLAALAPAAVFRVGARHA